MTREEMSELKELLREAARVIRAIPEDVAYDMDTDGWRGGLANELVAAAVVVSASERNIVTVKNEDDKVIGYYMLIGGEK